MRKQQATSNANVIYPPEHPNASKRIPYFLSSGQSTMASNNGGGQAWLPNGNGNGNGNGNVVNGNNNGNGNGHSQSVDDPVANYTLQGVMQWLNGEYRRYERDRNTWEIERASLVAQVSHLMGTKLGTQKVQDDLVRQNRILERKIKALEFALKAERNKNSGKETSGDMSRSPTLSASSDNPGIVLHVINPVDTDITPLLTHPDRQRSRKLLESCMREINYLMTPQTIPVDQPPSQEWQLYAQRESLQPQSNDAMTNLTEEPSYIRVENEASSRQTEDEELPRKLPRKATLPTETQETWDFTPPPETDTKTTILERPNSSRPSSKKIFSETKSTDQRTFQHIHTLRSHLSPVRTLIPYNSSSTLPDETCYITAGDDALIKFWRVNRTGATPKKKGNFDILPQITYRGHTGIVTCLAESAGNIWSGGSDGGIRGWKTPIATRDAYGSSNDAISSSILEGHTNCIWSLAVPGTLQPLLASASADGCVKIWDTRVNSRSPLRASFKYHDKVNPTCVTWDWAGRGILIGWENAMVEMWDVERGIATTKMMSDFGDGKSTQVNCFVKHPTEEIIIAGYEDRNIRLFDTRTGECTSSFIAHLDSISSLAISPDGKTLLSGAHDASVRFWDLSDKTCLQEALPPHRPRGDEGVLAVAWGDDQVAGSAGADGIVKLYVEV